MSDTPSSRGSHDNPQETPHDAQRNADKDHPPPVIVDEYGQPIHKAEDPSDKKQATEKEILDRVKTSEGWMIVLTAVVAISAVFQTIQSCNNNASTSQQVDKIISASAQFSESAEHINQGIGQAVTKLQTQADKMDAARTSSEKNSIDALQSTISNFKRQQRPWITIESIEPRDYPFNRDTNVSLYAGYHGIGVISQATATLRNTGLSPAINVVFDTEGINFDANERWPETAVVDFCNSLTKYKVQGFSIFPGETPSRNVSGVVPDKQNMNGQLGIFLPGMIVCVAYRSTVDEEWHYTGRVYKIDKKPLIGSMYGVFNRSQLPLGADKLTIEAMPFPDATN